jgi:hypothetical protein
MVAPPSSDGKRLVDGTARPEGQLMDAVVPLLAAVLGGLVVYGLSGRRALKEWRYEKRAEVLAELYRLLSSVQNTARMATIPDVSLEVRKQRIMANRKAIEELLIYYHAHTLWIGAELLPTVEALRERPVLGAGTLRSRDQQRQPR